MQGHLRALLLMVLAFALAGCANWRSKGHLDYRTVPADPHHDSEQAKAENLRAIGLIEKGKAEKAEQLLQKALIADVTYGPAHNNLGKLYFSQGKYYLAAWEFEYAAKLMPHRAECQNNLGQVYEAVGKLDEAIDAYSLALSMNAKHPVIIGNLARARVRRGEDDPALQQLLADLRLYDTRPEWLQWASEQQVFGPSADADRDVMPEPIRSPDPADKPDDGDLEADALDLGSPESVGLESIAAPMPTVEAADDLPLPRLEGADD